MVAISLTTLSSLAEAGRGKDLLASLGGASVAVVDASGTVIASKGVVTPDSARISEGDIVAALKDAQSDDAVIAGLWDVYANADNGSLLTLPVVSALVTATTSPKAREAMWSELAELLRRATAKGASRNGDAPLLVLFERHRAQLRPLILDRAETETAGEKILELMKSSKVFGEDFNESLAFVGAMTPGALARRIERDRGAGRPVAWEDAAFEHMLKWKRDRFLPGAVKAPQTLADWDRVGEEFALIFNCLHPLDDRYRKRMLDGVGPVQVFNAVVGGEFELYRMGTSSYRGFLHDALLKGLKDSGSFETFLAKAARSWGGQETDATTLQRGMVLLRVASSFGRLDDILAVVKDRDLFIDHAIHALGDKANLERNGLVVLDLLTSSASSAAARSFRQALLDTLYKSYDVEPTTTLKTIYGSLLSIYQTITGERRDRSIDGAFPIDDALFRVPFNKLYSVEAPQRFVHRMFMRLDEDTDAVSTYGSFRVLARTRGASHRQGRHHDVFRFAGRGRAVEIYVNKPTSQGVKQGIQDIAAELSGKRVETVVGRGHSGILKPLKESSKRVLGNRIGDVSLVLVGTCGGDASIPELVDTFGYVSYYATRSTGRQIINNAIMETYIDSLLAMQPGRRLSLAEVLDASTRRFLQKRNGDDLSDDASFYRLSAKRVLLARLLDTHVDGRTRALDQAAR